LIEINVRNSPSSLTVVEEKGIGMPTDGYIGMIADAFYPKPDQREPIEHLAHNASCRRCRERLAPSCALSAK